VFPETAQRDRTGDDSSAESPPPPPAVFPETVHLSSSGEESSSQYTPPPPSSATFSEIVQSESLGDERLQYSPPPLSTAAEFFEIVHPVRTGDEPSEQYTPAALRPRGVQGDRAAADRRGARLLEVQSAAVLGGVLRDDAVRDRGGGAPVARDPAAAEAAGEESPGSPVSVKPSRTERPSSPFTKTATLARSGLAGAAAMRIVVAAGPPSDRTVMFFGGGAAGSLGLRRRLKSIGSAITYSPGWTRTVPPSGAMSMAAWRAGDPPGLTTISPPRAAPGRTRSARTAHGLISPLLSSIIPMRGPGPGQRQIRPEIPFLPLDIVGRFEKQS